MTLNALKLTACVALQVVRYVKQEVTQHMVRLQLVRSAQMQLCLVCRVDAFAGLWTSNAFADVPLDKA